VTREGRSEWEPIKVLLERDDNSNKMNLVGYPKSHALHTTFRFPKPRSHCSTTGPRNKHYLQPQLLHTRQRKRLGCCLASRGGLIGVRGRLNCLLLGRQETHQNTSSELQNSPWFHPLEPLVKAKLATRESWQNQNFTKRA
jgi:hypothetical protein